MILSSPHERVEKSFLSSHIGARLQQVDSAEQRVMKICGRLKDFIRKRNRTQRAVERALGWGNDYLSQLLNGHADLKLVQMLKVLDAIEVSEREFFADVYVGFEREMGLIEMRRRSQIAATQAVSQGPPDRPVVAAIAEPKTGEYSHYGESQAAVEVITATYPSLSPDATLELARALAAATLRAQDLEARLARLEANSASDETKRAETIASQKS